MPIGIPMIVSSSIRMTTTAISDRPEQGRKSAQRLAVRVHRARVPTCVDVGHRLRSRRLDEAQSDEREQQAEARARGQRRTRCPDPSCPRAAASAATWKRTYWTARSRVPSGMKRTPMPTKTLGRRRYMRRAELTISPHARRRGRRRGAAWLHDVRCAARRISGDQNGEAEQDCARAADQLRQQRPTPWRPPCRSSRWRSARSSRSPERRSSRPARSPPTSGSAASTDASCSGRSARCRTPAAARPTVPGTRATDSRRGTLPRRWGRSLRRGAAAATGPTVSSQPTPCDPFRPRNRPSLKWIAWEPAAG